MPNLIGAATQVNQSASNVNAIVKSDPGFLAYIANSNPSTIYVRTIDETTGLPTGSEIALSLPDQGLFGGVFQLADRSFLVGQFETTANFVIATETLRHFSTDGALLSTRDLGAVSSSSSTPGVVGFQSVAPRPDGGYDIVGPTFASDGNGGTTATLIRTSYSASDVQTGSQTIATETFASGEYGVLSAYGTYSPSGALVTQWTKQVVNTNGASSTANVLLPGSATPITYTAPPNSDGTYYSISLGFVGFEPDGSVIYSIQRGATTRNADNTFTNTDTADVYHVVGSAPQLIFSTPSASINLIPGYAAGFGGADILTNGDIAFFSSPIINGGNPTVSVYSPQGQFRGVFTGYLGVTSGGQFEEFYVQNGNLYAQLAQAKWRDNFLAAGKSDLLLQNKTGAVAIGELGASDQLNYLPVAALGDEWKFKGNGDFLGDGDADFLIRNTNGAVVVGDVQNGSAVYTTVGGLGSEWTFVGTGAFLGNGHDQFLIENDAGAIVVGDVQNGQAQYTQVASLGSEWKFRGAGDFLGAGHDQFLIENDAGAIVVGDVQNGQAQYTQVASLGSEWKFKGAGDFLGVGRDSFLIENDAGAVVVGDVQNGQTQYAQVGALGHEWSFIGTGDYLGDGSADFIIENTAGAVFLGTIANGQASYAQVGALGSEWTSYS